MADAPQGPNAAFLSSYQSDLWPSQATAEASFRRSKFFKKWDSRALERFFHYGLRDTPTALYLDQDAGSVTLTTTKHQEAWAYVRSNFTPQSIDPHDPVEHLLNPDVVPMAVTSFEFTRPEIQLSYLGLPHLRPSVLWLYGEHSLINLPVLHDKKMILTGSGIGGSGGVKTGKVETIVIEAAGHMVPMEKVQESADLMAR